MIANICAFLLCCFAITSNMKTTESAGNQVTPVQLFYPLCTGWYVNIIKRLKTFNKRSIIIKTAEQNILTKHCDNLKGIKLRIKSLRKLKKKVQDIKCSFCVTINSKILYMKSLVEKLKRGEPYIQNDDTVISLREDAGIIVYLLLFGSMETDKWLWTYYLKVFAISHYEVNKHFIEKNPFEDDELQTGVSDFIEYCKSEKYLPRTKTESDLVLKNPNIHKNMFDILRNSEFSVGILLDRDFFTIDFLYLKPFWDENELLFGQITEATVDWSTAKQRFELEVIITREFVENRTWINKPYGRLDHQKMLMKILDARYYCYLTVILHIYVKQLSILDEQTLTHIRELINNVLFEILKFTTFKDSFLLNTLIELKYENVNDIGPIKDILARSSKKANEILNDLNGIRESGIDYLSFNVNEQQLSTDDLIIRIIKELDDYINNLDIFLGFEYKLFLHFIGEAKIETLA